MFHRKSIVSTLLTLALAHLAAFPAQGEPGLAGVDELAATRASLAPTALHLAAERGGWLASELKVLAEATADFELQRTRVHTFKILDPDGGIASVSLDASGNEVRLDDLRRRELQTHDERYGRLDPALRDRLQSGEVTGPIEIAIWLKQPGAIEAPPRPEPTGAHDPELTPGEVAAIERSIDASRSAAVRRIVEPVIARIAGLGGEPAPSTGAPMIQARLSRAAIERLAEWPEVDRIYEAAGGFEPQQLATRRTVHAPEVNLGRGLLGTGVRVAAVEVGGQVDLNPFLSHIVRDETNTCNPAAAPDHAMSVAGIIGNAFPTYLGIAAGAELWVGGSCSGNTNQLQSAGNAAATWGARIFNLSYGSPTLNNVGAHARFWDDMVRNRARTVVVSAGNTGAGVISPGTAFNVITVGNSYDSKSSSWNDDIMWSTSSFIDPPSRRGDRQKPEIAAPGTYMRGATPDFPYFGYIGTGTSFAAPVVAGGAALMVQRNGWLAFWPEAVKAILMASAVNNIEGNARLSDRDGAGGVVLDRADDVVTRLAGDWGGRGYSCSTATTLDVDTIQLSSLQRVRAVIAWDNNSADVNYAIEPSADLDLQLISPFGTVVASSSSFDNTFEIVDAVVPWTGTYTLRVRKFRCSSSPGYLGWALHEVTN